MSVRYSYTRNEDGTANITVLGEFTRSIASNHPNFIALRDYLQAHEDDADADEVLRLVDAGKTAQSALKRLSERIVVEDDTLFFDGDKIDNLLSRQIIRMSNDNDFQTLGLVAFMEKLATNPSKKSRRSLFAYVDRHGFSLTEDGDFLAYKGVTRKFEAPEGIYHSIRTGTASVNDVEFTGPIPQKVGDVVTMPRLTVDEDREVACSEGLHAGTFSYATDFGHGHTLQVLINPRDVVAVPKDCDEQKLRVCRYVITEVNGGTEHKSASYESPLPATIIVSYDDDDELVVEDECYYCGEDGHTEEDCNVAEDDEAAEQEEADRLAALEAEEAEEADVDPCWCGDPNCGK